MADSLRPLHQLAAACGVQRSYTGHDGRITKASPESIVLALKALGEDIRTPRDAERLLRSRKHAARARLLEPVHVLWEGKGRIDLPSPPDRSLACVLELESGERHEWMHPAGAARIQVPLVLPTGRHRLHLQRKGAEASTVLLSAPTRLPESNARDLGLFVPLYALHSRRSRSRWGVGDLADLRRLAGWAAGLGCSLVGTLPLLACFLDEEVFEPSPYAPASRLFWNELFLDVEQVVRQVGGAVRPLTSRDADGDWVDYRQAAAAKERALRPLARTAWQRDALRRELAAFTQGDLEVESYARFRSEVLKRGVTWQQWPNRLRTGRLGGSDDEVTRYHIFVQWMMQRQLRRLASGSTAALYLDLPIGVHAGSYDVWRHRDAFALNAAVGAPPDVMFTGGQNWGFPPPHPQRTRADGHDYFTRCLRNHFRFAKVLRLDHVMGLHRLFWIPEGVDTREGVYVRYPAEELLAILSIEAHRAGARVVGENLGTVPEEVNQAMSHHGVLGMFVGQFALSPNSRRPLSPPPPVPQRTLATMNTHDTPTFAGFVSGEEIQLRRELGMLEDNRSQPERDDRAKLRQALLAYAKRRGCEPAPAPDGELMPALHALLKQLAEDDAEIVLIALEDLWLEERPQNVPGIVEGYPSWRRRTRLSLEQILKSRDLGEILGELVQARRRAKPDAVCPARSAQGRKHRARAGSASPKRRRRAQ